MSEEQDQQQAQTHTNSESPPWSPTPGGAAATAAETSATTAAYGYRAISFSVEASVIAQREQIPLALRASGASQYTEAGAIPRRDKPTANDELIRELELPSSHPLRKKQSLAQLVYNVYGSRNPGVGVHNILQQPEHAKVTIRDILADWESGEGANHRLEDRWRLSQNWTSAADHLKRIRDLRARDEEFAAWRAETRRAEAVAADATAADASANARDDTFGGQGDQDFDEQPQASPNPPIHGGAAASEAQDIEVDRAASLTPPAAAVASTRAAAAPESDALREARVRALETERRHAANRAARQAQYAAEIAQAQLADDAEDAAADTQRQQQAQP